MATTSQMILAGIAYAVCTFTLIWCAFIGDRIFQPIMKWYYSFNYNGVQPPLDPGMMTWIFPAYYALLILMWIGLTYAVISVIMNKLTYQYGGI
jgi:hypothetical protein